MKIQRGTEESRQFISLYGQPSSFPAFFVISSQGRLVSSICGAEITEDSVVRNIGKADSTAVAAMKQKLEEARDQKFEGERMSETESEIKRREEQKAMRDAKKAAEQRAQEAERLRAQKNMEESKRHREEVVNKIRSEREERARKKGVRDADQDIVENELSPPSSNSNVRPVATTTKIKFQLGDGAVVTHEFNNRDTLRTVKDYLTAQGYSNFTLETVFPRRTFVEEDYGKTLEALRLGPSCALIVKTGTSVLRGVGGVFSRGQRVESGPTNQPFPLFSSSSSSASLQERTTNHPNVDGTYIHPDDNETFFNDLVNGVAWLFSCCRARQRSLVSAVSSNSNAPSSETRNVSRTLPRRNLGTYTQVPDDSATEPNEYYGGSGTFTVGNPEDDF